MWEKEGGDEPESVTYLADFNAKLKLAEDAEIATGATSNNGAFAVTDDASKTAYYQLGKGEKLGVNARLAFSGVDTATITGRFYDASRADGTKAADASASTKNVTVVPASSVYFDDDLLDASLTIGDGSGYNADVPASGSTAAGSSKQTLTFTFTRTGVDVYCTTDDANGWIQATVDSTNKQPYTNTRYQGGGELKNVPVISFRNLDANVEHTLVITTLTGANFRLDGIRVYNPMGDSADAAVTKAYADAGEQNAVFLKVRKYIVDQNMFGSFTDQEKSYAGAVFTDKKLDQATVADYAADGPKNEVYLAAGQGVAFTIANWKDYAADTVMVGLSVPAGGTATVAASGATGNQKIVVKSETHMYYTIKPDAETGNVYIFNTEGSNMISVTDLKITGPEKYEVPAEQTAGEVLEANVNGLIVRNSTMAYVQAFDPEAVIAEPEPEAPDIPDTPETPDGPDDGKSSWIDDAANSAAILKALFRMVLKSLSSLFSSLGGW